MSVPFLDDGDVRLYHGDALAVLDALPAGSAQMCVTSPPYWGLRDYGTAEWTGGDPGHAHDRVAHRGGRGGSGAPGKQTADAYPSTTPAAVCQCGAVRVDAQLGLEASPDLYVERLVAIMRGVRRVLRDDGTLWLNLGDSYAGGGGYAPDAPSNVERQRAYAAGETSGFIVAGADRRTSPRQKKLDGVKAKDLVGVPWMVAFALRADGWYLRSDIVWAKPNPMPESVTDRPTKAHEMVFLLSKQRSYFYDADAIREAPAAYERPGGSAVWTADSGHTNGVGSSTFHQMSATGRNCRSVWEIPTQPTPEAHFATFPEALVRRCIQAGSSEHGECSACGAPWTRVVEREQTKAGEAYESRLERRGADFTPLNQPNRDREQVPTRYNISQSTAQTTGWQPTCACDAPVRAQTVLDPFIGSGTTALVARRLGRRAVGIDLSAAYLEIARRRTQQLSLLA